MRPNKRCGTGRVTCSIVLKIDLTRQTMPCWTPVRDFKPMTRRQLSCICFKQATLVWLVTTQVSRQPGTAPFGVRLRDALLAARDQAAGGQRVAVELQEVLLDLALGADLRR